MQANRKERDVAGTAAFEIALQYIMIRQDRSYHFVQLLTAISSLIFALEIILVVLFDLLLPVLNIRPEDKYLCFLEYTSPLAFIGSGICLLLLRVSRQRFAIEPGETLMERLNTEILEPCLGMHFDYVAGQMRSDNLWSTSIDPAVETG